MTPTRVLHVLGALNIGGVETWLMHMLRHCDRSRVAMDFMVHDPRPGVFDDEARTLGARLLPCPNRPHATFGRRLSRLLAEDGPYDVVHSHVHFFSGLVLRIAHANRVPVRIAHSHTCMASGGPLRRIYHGAMRALIRRHATAGIAVSQPTALDLFGAGWQDDARIRVLPYGIDLTPFATAGGRQETRRSLGIADDALLIGHVGRLSPEKNHAFLLEIMVEVAALRPDARLLLVGDGASRAALEQRAAALGVAERTIFAGARSDIATLLAAMDVFALPSLREGLPLALMESQASGLPAVVSRAVPDESEVVPGLVRRLGLDQPARTWAEALLAARRQDATASRAVVARSAFALEHGLEKLISLYTHGAPWTC